AAKPQRARFNSSLRGDFARPASQVPVCFASGMALRAMVSVLRFAETSPDLLRRSPSASHPAWRFAPWSQLTPARASLDRAGVVAEAASGAGTLVGAAERSSPAGVR